MICIEMNGNRKEIEDGATIAQLLDQSEISSRFCAVELNLEIVPKDEYGSRRLVSGDKLEVVTLVGGG
jgi:thiamine biosynthesis protein ThiS